MSDEKSVSMLRESRFKRWGLHTIIAAVISTMIATYGGYLASGKISQNLSRANLIKTFLPELLSGDPQQKKIALYAIRLGISDKIATDLERLVGGALAVKVSQTSAQGHLDKSKFILDEAAFISPGVYENAISRIRDYKPRTQVESNFKMELLKYKPDPSRFTSFEPNSRRKFIKSKD